MNPDPTEDKTESGERPEKSVEEPPRRERRRRITNKTKGYIAGGFFVAWIIFVAIWLLFMAGQGWSFFDNVAVITSAFFITAGAVGMMFSGEGPKMHKWRIRVSIAAGIGLVIFYIMWFPFVSAYFGFYQNAAIVFAVFMFFLFLMAATWVTASPVRVFRAKGLGSFGIAAVWVALVLWWLWFYAAGLTVNQNVAITFAVLLLLLFLAIAVAKFAVTVEGEITGYGALALFVALMVLMIAWFWFYADASGLNSYQNGAIVILSFLLFVALSYLWERRKHRREIPDKGW